jgi:hypothetical protein
MQSSYRRLHQGIFRSFKARWTSECLKIPENLPRTLNIALTALDDVCIVKSSSWFRCISERSVPAAVGNRKDRRRKQKITFLGALESPLCLSIPQPVRLQNEYNNLISFEEILFEFVIREGSVFWCKIPYSPVKVNRCFKRSYRFQFQWRRVRKARNCHEADQTVCGRKKILCISWENFKANRSYVAPNTRLNFNGLNGVISQDREFILVTAVRTSSSN